MEPLKDNILNSDYAVEQKWKNTETNNEFWITDISKSLVSIDNKKNKLSSFDHMNKILWNHLVKLGVFERAD